MSDLMTFIGGAAVGTLVTYLTKNQEARRTVERFIDGVGANVTAFLQKMTPGETQTAEATATKSKPKPKPVKKAAAGRKPAAARRAVKAKKVMSEGKAVH